ncbi:glycosyltransferase family 4 protein [Polynucleobacter sp. AP-Melu-500A-A1]|uniref:glycosyltransferase family 4 protein n=1 Tax=Polynucleobacter sp. AP-Melu-500A-A1 TaxID=2576929 RepID=UPI001C0CA131|nr:glycosyltransferase family 4 protein [Polynucleobacter sp. AP-Melu-500A-A1]MBU3630057.1 glycosyltransferase family 4 protein [Polynucleobacter sp. AP-Melu-500A-A1]
MHILIISDAYPPMRTSCATQIYDLAQAFIGQDHKVSIIIPAHSQKNVVEISNADGPTVYSVRCFKTKDVGYARRTIAEFINPFVIGFHLKRNSNFIGQKIDGIAWYSPTVFWGPLVRQLKAIFNCKAYLILRDIFPDWALDLGILKKNLIYAFFKKVERYQYSQADCIGVQSPNNISYLQKNNKELAVPIEVLWNWMGITNSKKSSIVICDGPLKGRNIFIYAGNLGIAQGIDCLIDLVIQLKDNKDIGFIFVGRGSEKPRLQEAVKKFDIQNVLIYDEIPLEEILSLYEQCDFGLLTLDSRHQTHNIPGKFLSYMQAKLPVFSIINPGNDLENIIKERQLGVSLAKPSRVNLKTQVLDLVLMKNKQEFSNNSFETIMTELFNPINACQQIIKYFGKHT